MRPSLVRTFALVVTLTSLFASNGEAQGARGAPREPVSLAGVWRSDGYGYVIVGRSDSLISYEATRTTCVPSFKAVRVRNDAAPDALVYGDGDSRFSLLGGRSADERRLHAAGAASDIIIRHVAQLPSVCLTPTTDTPQNNFEVFAQTWMEHYILFREKHADWPTIVAEARAKVTSQTTPNELFAIMSGMIAPFEDAHTSISAPSIKEQFRTLRKGSDHAAAHGVREFVQKDMPVLLGVTERQLQGALRKFCNEQVQYGHVNDTTGYLRILSESNYARGGFEGGLVALNAAFDTIFADPKLRGLIIDVRINFGGADPYGLALASRLATHAWTAYSKEARNDPVRLDAWTVGQPSVVSPSPRAGFHGPVVELTSGLTISAGETTTQALMGRRPRILRIGENTQGVFSDVLGRRMPNGWTFGLPNEVFRAADGKTFDGPGIPPDIAMTSFAPDDVAAGRDPVLARAVAELYKVR